jgi:hypothetical protein
VVRDRLTRTSLALATIALLASACFAPTTTSTGISIPGDPTLGELGLRLRCVEPGDTSCTDRALEIAEAMLVRLGTALPPTDPDDPLRVPFTIQVDRDPAWEWRSAGGPGGTTRMVAIDLEPFLAGRGDATARINGDDPRFGVPAGLTTQLLDALFVPED